MTKFLQPETIGVIPAQGYNPEQVQSVKALQWILFLSHAQGIRIQHARNGGEKVLGQYMVDGYYETETGEKVVLEFHGDFWHGNPVKFASSTVYPGKTRTMGGTISRRLLDKKHYLENLGYSYQCIVGI